MEGKILDRLVLYDFIGILFTGFTAIILSYALGSWGIFNIFNFELTISFGNALVYVVLAYLIGITLHEVSILFMKKTMHKTGKPSEKFLAKNINGFNEHDIKMLDMAIKMQLGDFSEKFDVSQKENAYYIYDYCKLFLRKEGIYGNVENIQSLYILSRSLFAYCVIAIVIFFIVTLRIVDLHEISNCMRVGICEACLFILSYIFYIRTKKFGDIVVSRTLKSFIVSVIGKSNN